MKKRRPMTFLLAGVLFVAAALSSLTSLVAMVSTFKSEVGVKLRKTSLFLDPVLRYKYGSGVYCAVVSLLSLKASATLAFFVYIRCHEQRKEGSSRNRVDKKKRSLLESECVLDDTLDFGVRTTRGRRSSRTTTLGLESLTEVYDKSPFKKNPSSLLDKDDLDEEEEDFLRRLPVPSPPKVSSCHYYCYDDSAEEDPFSSSSSITLQGQEPMTPTFYSYSQRFTQV